VRPPSRPDLLVQAFRQRLSSAARRPAGGLARLGEAQAGSANCRALCLWVERDKAAVVAGLTLPYSNGPVEGFVTKVKLLKRMMYGRASFALLRQRVLYAA
jgi:transposase